MADADGDGYGDIDVQGQTLHEPIVMMPQEKTYPGAAENDSLVDCMSDADEDGYGDENAQAPVIAGTDCDDTDLLLTPVDADGDGSTICDGDCVDTDPDIFFGAAQIEGPDSCMKDSDDDGYGDNNPPLV